MQKAISSAATGVMECRMIDGLMWEYHGCYSGTTEVLAFGLDTTNA